MVGVAAAVAVARTAGGHNPRVCDLFPLILASESDRNVGIRDSWNPDLELHTRGLNRAECSSSDMDGTPRTLLAFSLLAATALVFFLLGARRSDSFDFLATTADVGSKSAAQRRPSVTASECPWQPLNDSSLGAACSVTYLHGPPSAHPNQFSTVTWHSAPNFIMMAYTTRDYITMVSLPNQSFFEEEVSEFFTETLSRQKAKLRGPGGSTAEEACSSNPVWFLDVSQRSS